MGITNTLALLFTRSFLLTWEYQQTVDKYLKVLVVSGLLSIILPVFISQSAAFKMAILQAIITMSSLLAVGFYGVFKRYRRAYYFTSAWFVLCVGIILKSVNALDLLPTNFLTVYGAQLGGVLEVMLLAFALADRINIERAEKLEAMSLALLASGEQLASEKN